MSEASHDMSKREMEGVQQFYRSSEVLPHVYPTSQIPVVLDSAGITEIIVQSALRTVSSRLHDLLTWKDGWNGYDLPAPDSNAVARAQHWIVMMYQAIDNVGREWRTPEISGGPEGEVIFEWWYGRKKLTIYVSSSTAEYVQVWGPDVNSEMQDGEVNTFSSCQHLWLWLTAE